MTSAARRRGQPLVALTGLMGGWVAMRALVPSGDFLDVPVPPNVVNRVGEPAPVMAEAVTPARPEAEAGASAPVPVDVPHEARTIRPLPLTLPPPPVFFPSPAAIPSHTPVAVPPTAPPAATVPAGSAPAIAPRLLPFSPSSREASGRRWSADSWLLWRKGSEGATNVPGALSYGASQAGAVLRYRLAHDTALHPRAHMRATGALDTPDRELAAGVGVQPVKQLPLEILAEGRIGRFSGDTLVRPAVVGVFGPPPQALPLNLEIELYAQAGYVGGSNATGFADGQARVTRSIDVGPATVQAGAGVWGGAQRDVERIDIGPSLSVTAPVGGGIFARASIDWRERVAGDAQPASGPVITLSAGF